ncbi:MAG: hypothetical protein RLN75_04055 [Longimicrobiales bacterium]
MPRTDFSALPDDARLWVFAADRPVEGDHAEALLARVDAFLDAWNAHGHPLTGARRWDQDRFLFVAVDERTAPPSGCSIDALHRVLKDFEAERGVGLTDHVDVLWRDGEGRVVRSSRPDFARLAREGEVDFETPVFDTTLTRKGALIEGFEVPAGSDWHRRAFWRGA